MIYTTEARVEAYLQRNLTDYEGTIIDDVIEYISQYISTYTNRVWFSAIDEDGEDSEQYEDYGDASARYFDGNGEKEVYIDDFTSATQVDILDSDGNVFATLTAADFEAYPLNTNPKESIRLRHYRTPNRPGCVKVTAKWGSGQAPKAVIMVATILVAKFFAQSDQSKKPFKSESIEGYSYSLQSSAEHDSEIKKALSTLDIHKKLSL